MMKNLLLGFALLYEMDIDPLIQQHDESIQSQLPNQLDPHRTTNRERLRQRRSRMIDHQRQSQQTYNRQYNLRRNASMSEAERAAHQTPNRERARTRRAQMTEEQRERQRAYNRTHQRLRRSRMTESQQQQQRELSRTAARRRRHSLLHQNEHLQDLEYQHETNRPPLHPTAGLTTTSINGASVAAQHAISTPTPHDHSVHSNMQWGSSNRELYAKIRSFISLSISCLLISYQETRQRIEATRLITVHDRDEDCQNPKTYSIARCSSIALCIPSLRRALRRLLLPPSKSSCFQIRCSSGDFKFGFNLCTPSLRRALRRLLPPPPNPVVANPLVLRCFRVRFQFHPHRTC